MHARNFTGGTCPCWQTAAWCLWDWWNRIRVSTLLRHLDTSVEGDTSGSGVRSCRRLWFSREVVAGVTCKSLHLRCPELQEEHPAEACCGAELCRCFAMEGRVRLLLWSEELLYITTTKMVLLDQCPAVLQNIIKCLCRVRAAERVILSSALVCGRGAQCRLWSVTPYRDFVGLQWQDTIRPHRGMCRAGTVLGEVFSGNLQATGGISIVQNVLQPVFEQLRTQDPVLGTWPQHGGGKCCSWRRIRKANVKFRKTAITNELRLELCFPTFSCFPKRCHDRSDGEGGEDGWDQNMTWLHPLG